MENPSPGAAEAPAPLVLRDVGVSLGRTVVLQGVNLTLQRGDFAWLSGPNGAGKSTLLRAAVGLLPASGDIEIAGAHPRSLTARAAFAFAPDEAVLYEDLSLAEHVRFTALVYRRPESERVMLGWLERFGLLERLRESPSTHSRGMRQKLALALALGLEPPLLLLDEPYNGLDAHAQAELSRGLQARAAQGGAVLLSAHQAEVTARLGARVLVLEDGRLLDALGERPDDEAPDDEALDDEGLEDEALDDEVSGAEVPDRAPAVRR